MERMIRFMFKFLLKSLKKNNAYIVYKDSDYAIVKHGDEYTWLLEHFSGTIYKEDIFNIFDELVKELDVEVKYRCDSCWNVFSNENELENYGGIGAWCKECREL